MSNCINATPFFVGKYYEVSDIVLGRGSFSTVYLARHKVFATKVALKVIDRKNIKEEYVLKNLHREAKILRKLNHPNIVNFYEEFLHKNLYCIAMEHISGPDLSFYLKKQVYHRLSEHSAKILFYQMVMAVQHMHESNILHRDLKQENILLEYGRVIKIVDFGLSNTYQPKVQLRTHCGSLVYAAPELFQHRSVYGAGVDLWSLGVILYSMVVGSMPFEISKDQKSTISQSNKDRFLKRISKGLTEQNWEKMGHLSYDCSNLLESLLQPNQFKRLGIVGAGNHPWLTKDTSLKNRLPQHRMDLKRKFEPEVIEIMADRLNQPMERIRLHLITGGKYDKVSAMFYILQDTLMKEVLFPPRDLENSFIYQLECRRKSHSSSHAYESDESDSKISGSRNSKNSKTRGGTYISRYFDHEANNKSKLSGSRSERESRNIADIRRRIGDGDHGDMESKAARRNNFKTNPLVSKTEKESSKIRSTISDKPSIPNSKAYNVSDPPFRSYKSNRPVRELKEPATRKTGVNLPRHPGDFISHPEENDYLEISESKSDFSSGSVNMNNPNEVKVLNEKFYNMCRITPQNIKDNLYNVEHGSFNRQNNAVTSNMNQLQQRKFVPGLLNMKQYSADNFKQHRKYDLRPNTTQSLMKPASADVVPNNISSEQSPSNLSQNAKLNHQLRQRSMVIRRSNTSSNASESSNKIPTNKFQYGPPTAYIQNQIYGMSTKKSSTGGRKSYNVNLNSQDPVEKSMNLETKQSSEL